MDTILESSYDLITYDIPHAVVLSLYLASFRSMFVLCLYEFIHTWKAQRISCQRFFRLAVYLNANTVYSA